jgi:hypothetical protein
MASTSSFRGYAALREFSGYITKRAGGSDFQDRRQENRRSALGGGLL